MKSAPTFCSGARSEHDPTGVEGNAAPVVGRRRPPCTRQRQETGFDFLKAGNLHNLCTRRAAWWLTKAAPVKVTPMSSRRAPLRTTRCRLLVLARMVTLLLAAVASRITAAAPAAAPESRSTRVPLDGEGVAMHWFLGRPLSPLPASYTDLCPIAPPRARQHPVLLNQGAGTGTHVGC